MKEAKQWIYKNGKKEFEKQSLVSNTSPVWNGRTWHKSHLDRQSFSRSSYMIWPRSFTASPSSALSAWHDAMKEAWTIWKGNETVQCGDANELLLVSAKNLPKIVQICLISIYILTTGHFTSISKGIWASKVLDEPSRTRSRCHISSNANSQVMQCNSDI